MESKYNITEIITQVGDIGQMISRMKTEGPVPAIEIDIVLEKIRNLYTDVSNLKEFNHLSARQPARPALALPWRVLWHSTALVRVFRPRSKIL